MNSRLLLWGGFFGTLKLKVRHFIADFLKKWTKCRFKYRIDWSEYVKLFFSKANICQLYHMKSFTICQATTKWTPANKVKKDKLKHMGAETLDEYSSSGKLKKGEFRIRQKAEYYCSAFCRGDRIICLFLNSSILLVFSNILPKRAAE